MRYGQGNDTSTKPGNEYEVPIVGPSPGILVEHRVRRSSHIFGRPQSIVLSIYGRVSSISAKVVGKLVTKKSLEKSTQAKDKVTTMKKRDLDKLYSKDRTTQLSIALPYRPSMLFGPGIHPGQRALMAFRVKRQSQAGNPRRRSNRSSRSALPLRPTRLVHSHLPDDWATTQSAND